MSSPADQLQSQSPVVTLRDIKQACKAQSYAQATRHAQEVSEAEKKAAFMKVFEALLGVKAEDEVKAMPPEELRRVARRRIREGLVTVKGIDPDVLLDKVIQKVRSERRAAWKDCFISVCGEAAAIKIVEATPESYSYKFVAP